MWGTSVCVSFTNTVHFAACLHTPPLHCNAFSAHPLQSAGEGAPLGPRQSIRCFLSFLLLSFLSSGAENADACSLALAEHSLRVNLSIRKYKTVKRPRRCILKRGNSGSCRTVCRSRLEVKSKSGHLPPASFTASNNSLCPFHSLYLNTTVKHSHITTLTCEDRDQNNRLKDTKNGVQLKEGNAEGNDDCVFSLVAVLQPSHIHEVAS